MNIPSDRRYAKSHEWVQVVGKSNEGRHVRVGISDFAQDALGDVVYVDLPDVDAVFSATDQMVEVESTKSVADVFAPVSGTVVAVNEELDDSPKLVNSDPYGTGWFVELTLNEPSELDDLLSADQYLAQVTEG
jgi:glycine cleavage system H protein